MTEINIIAHANYFKLFYGVMIPLSLVVMGIAHSLTPDEQKTTTVDLRVAAGQFQLQPDLEANLEKIKEFLNHAAKKNVDLIVFPECALTGYPPKDRTTLDYVDHESTEKALGDLKQRAKELHIAIAIGTAWKDEENVWRNRSFFIDENGEILAHYDKIQQTGHERKFFVDGKRLPTFQWRGLRIGMLICMDMRFPELWRLMRKDGVNLMLHLASAMGNDEWKVPVLEGTMRCRAAENGYFIVSCNNAGPIPMMVSGIYTPRGLMLAKANYAVDELIAADIQVGEPQGFVDFADEVYKLQRVTKE